MTRSRPGNMATQLAGVAVLRELSPQQRGALVRRARRFPVRKGTIIFDPGAPPGFYVVLCGRVVLLARPSPGAEMELFDRRAGDVFGELSLLLDKHISEARAADDSDLLRLDPAALHRALRESPPATLALATLTARRSALAESRLAEVALHKVKDRLACLLQHLAAGSGNGERHDILLHERFTHEELACMLGVGRVAVTRALGKLRREGRLLLRDRRLTVRARNSTE